MSKAFTCESDDLLELNVKKPGVLVLPPDVKNYFTLEGINKLRNGLQDLSSQTLLPSIRQRVSEIEENLKLAVIAEPPPGPWEQVLFGAFVTVRNHSSPTASSGWETDLDRNHISWLSPVAKALKAHIGEHIRLSVRRGTKLGNC